MGRLGDVQMIRTTDLANWYHSAVLLQAHLAKGGPPPFNALDGRTVSSDRRRYASNGQDLQIGWEAGLMGFLDKLKALFGSGASEVRETLETAIDKGTDMASEVSNAVESMASHAAGSASEAVEGVASAATSTASSAASKASGTAAAAGGSRSTGSIAAMSGGTTKVEITVNGKKTAAEVEDRMFLSAYLREKRNLTGTHIGCDTSQCGACVVHVDGKAVKSCTMLAVQASGSEVTTIEGLAGDDLHPMQAAFRENHGLQCGFCTPGMIMTAVDIVNREGADVDEKTIREQLEGNICRCTGYHNIVKSIAAGAKRMAAS